MRNLSGCPRPAKKSARIGDYAGPKLRDCVQLNVRVSVEAKDKLIELRETRGLSMGDIIETLIQTSAARETWWEDYNPELARAARELGIDLYDPELARAARELGIDLYAA